MSLSARKKKLQIEMAMVCFLIVGQLIFLFVMFSGLSVKKEKTELADLREKISAGELLIARKSQITKEYTETIDRLDSLRVHVPPTVDPYAWAYEYVSSRAGQSEIKLDAVDAIDSSRGNIGKPNSAGAKKQSSEYYMVSVSMTCSYDQTVSFLRRLEEDNPLLFISQVKIESDLKDKIRHKTTIQLRWPSGFAIEKGDAK